jgi:4-aminobutyrate aminotransferase-like enzyme
VLDRGEGCYVWDTDGKRYLDGLSALFCAQIGYGRQELVDAATEQMAQAAVRDQLVVGAPAGRSTSPASSPSASPATSTTSSSSTPARRRSSRR